MGLCVSVKNEDGGGDELEVMLDAGRGLFQPRRPFIPLEPLVRSECTNALARVKHDTSSGHGPRPSRSLRLDSRVPADITPTYPRLRTFAPPYPASPRPTVCPPTRTLRQPCSGPDRTRAISVLVRTTQSPDRPARPGCPLLNAGSGERRRRKMRTPYSYSHVRGIWPPPSRERYACPLVQASLIPPF